MFKQTFKTAYGIPSGLFTDTLLDLVQGEFGKEPAYSFYNKLNSKDGKSLTLQFAFAGYNKSDITVTQEKSILQIKTQEGSSMLPKSDDDTVAHRGISNKKHDLKFKLSEGATISEVKFENGLLSIVVNRPEPAESDKKIFSID